MQVPREILEIVSRAHAADLLLEPWRQRYGSLEPADVKRLRQLEQENTRLKTMVADRDLEIDVLKEITRKQW